MNNNLTTKFLFHIRCLGLILQVFDSPERLDQKITEFVKLVRESKHIVFHTGAGVSTSVGIPDFRGPKGVWTLEEKGKTPQMETTFDDAKPSLTHMAVVKLVEQNVVQYIVSQNVDGLHIKSGLSRYFILIIFRLHVAYLLFCCL